MKRNRLIKDILNKCHHEDFVFLSKVLNTYVSFANDRKRKKLLEESKTGNKSKAKLMKLLDKQIRYFGSADLAYLKRVSFGFDGGVSALEIVDDICKKMGVKIKQGGGIETKLERLTTAFVEKEIISKSPKELSEEFSRLGVANQDMELIIEHIKTNSRVLVLPIMVKVLGPKITLGIVESVVISLLSQIVGKEIAKQLVKELAKRNPWLNALGPVLWTISGVWLALDIQGPAYRKTIPIFLYLGIVALRDGEEDSR